MIPLLVSLLLPPSVDALDPLAGYAVYRERFRVPICQHASLRVDVVREAKRGTRRTNRVEAWVEGRF